MDMSVKVSERENSDDHQFEVQASTTLHRGSVQQPFENYFNNQSDSYLPQSTSHFQ